MKAMIFAAGIGTRLQPLSLQTPKALVKVGNKPMLQMVAEKLVAAGATTLVINIHHHPDQMLRYIESMHFPNVEIFVSDETNELLDTGGGLLYATPLLQGSDPIILYNADVLSDINLAKMLAFHKKHSPLATLAVSHRPTNRAFLWENNQLVGWENRATGEKIYCKTPTPPDLISLAFSGIHIVQPNLLNLIAEKGVFSITPVYLRLAQNHCIMPFVHNHDLWADIGSMEKLEKAKIMFSHNPKAF